MQIEKLNEIFSSSEIKLLLTRIAGANDFRMCLNKDVMEEFRRLFASVILCSFVANIEPCDLDKIYRDAESFLADKLSAKLGIKDIYKAKDKVAEYFNKTLGGKQIYFHGTLSNMESSIFGQVDSDYVKLELCKNIDEIYCRHGIYAAFEAGIRDFEHNSFWLTRSPNSACFYALQSPEYFARFCSRSDYYKQDIYKYDRIAYYRKDYDACKKNIMVEAREFGFSKPEREVILKNYKKLWDSVVTKNMGSVILMCEESRSNLQKFDGSETLMQMLTKYFWKENFPYDISMFKKNFKGKIVLPDIKLYLRRQPPINDKKFVVFGDKKYYPDFYIDCKYSEHLYFSFDENAKHLLQISNDAAKIDKKLLIKIANEARPNTSAAKKFLKTQKLPSTYDVISFYREEFSDRVHSLQNAKNLAEKIEIVKQICHDDGLKFIVSLKYNQFFKDINQFCIKTYRSLLGAKLFEHYDGISVITDEKIDKLLHLYKEILSGNFDLNENLPLKSFKSEIKFMK